MNRISSRLGRSGSLRLLLATSLLATPVLADGTDCVDVDGEGASCGMAAASGGEIEGEMNCFEIHFVGTDVRAIVQNYPEMGPHFASHMATFAKYLYRSVVLEADSTLATHRRSGDLFGIEYDWFFPPLSPAAAGLHLPDPVDVRYNDGVGDPTLLAQVYGYGEANYALKKAMIEQMIGHPMDTYPVFETDLLDAGSAGLIEVSGSHNDVHGPSFAGSGLHVTGIKNTLATVGTAGRHFVRAGNEVEAIVPGRLFAAARGADVERMRRFARQRGTYVHGDLRIDADHLPPAGLVFAEGSITLSGDGVQGRWTLVSADGDVSLRADDTVLEPSYGNLAAVAFSGDIELRGDGNLWIGSLLAPDGRLELTGSDNTLLGTFTGSGVQLTGSDNVLTDGTRPLQP